MTKEGKRQTMDAEQMIGNGSHSTKGKVKQNVKIKKTKIKKIIEINI
jgi:hypothetical protein